MEYDALRATSLASPIRHGPQFGIPGVSYSDSQVLQCARKAIAHALVKHQFELTQSKEQAAQFFFEAGVRILDGPTVDLNTFHLLQQRDIQYPNFYKGFPPTLRGSQIPDNSHNPLDDLICVWYVSGYHQYKPELQVSLLLGGYRETSYHSVLPLGRRVGLRWVSPI